jgi:hypothetical protein
MSIRTNAVGAAIVSALILLVGCSPSEPTSEAPGVATPTSASAPTAFPESSNPSSGVPGEVPNDLAASPFRKTFKSSGLTFNVVYTTPVPVDQWTPDGPQSIQVTLTVHNPARPKQKLYLTQTTVQFVVRAADGALPTPEPIVDSSQVSPGYLVTSPYRSEQSLAVPALDNTAVSLELLFKYELVSLVDINARDYTKQTANHTVRVALDF